MSETTAANHSSLGNQELFELWLLRNPLAAIILDSERGRSRIESVFGVDLDEMKERDFDE